jgi:hypothetical protein
MMLDDSLSTLMFVPMAASLGFGVLMGTVVTLFLVPCLLLVREDVMRLRGGAAQAAAHGSDPKPAA